jgi:hypothetical protein
MSMGSSCVPILADVSLSPYEVDFIEGNRKYGAMDSVSALSGIDCWFDPQSCQPKHNAIDMCCFSSKHTLLRRKSKHLLDLNHDNDSEWVYMVICELLFAVS